MSSSIIPNGIKVISFDLDDTLWSGPQVIRHAEQASRDWMQENTPEVFAQFNSDQLLEKRIAFLKNNPNLKNQISLSRQIFLEQLFAELGYGDAARLAEECFQTFYLARQNVTLFENVLETLHQLKKQYQLISITNGNADVAKTDLAGIFELSLIAEHFERPKPHGDMFDHALSVLGCDANDVLHVGDHPVHDMQGAYDAGMKTCWLDDGTRQWQLPFTAHLTISHIRELIP